jgi:hypothetical protein
MEGPSAGWHGITVALHLFQQPEPVRELVSFKLDSFAFLGGRRELHACLYSDRRPLPERDLRRIPPDATPLSTTLVPIWEIFARLLGVADPEEIAARKAH